MDDKQHAEILHALKKINYRLEVICGVAIALLLHAVFF